MLSLFFFPKTISRSLRRVVLNYGARTFVCESRLKVVSGNEEVAGVVGSSTRAGGIEVDDKVESPPPPPSDDDSGTDGAPPLPNTGNASKK